MNFQKQYTMKKIMITAFVALFVAFAAQAQQSEPQETANGAEITFEKTVHDFGNNIPKGSKDVECEFIFTNTGNEPLILSNVRANCGCTTPGWSRQPVLPGKTGSVKAKYTTTHRASTFRKQITVSSNAVNGTQILTIKGKVVNKPEESTVEKEPEGAPNAN